MSSAVVEDEDEKEKTKDSIPLRNRVVWEVAVTESCSLYTPNEICLFMACCGEALRSIKDVNQPEKDR